MLVLKLVNLESRAQFLIVWVSELEYMMHILSLISMSDFLVGFKLGVIEVILKFIFYF